MAHRTYPAPSGFARAPRRSARPVARACRRAVTMIELLIVLAIGVVLLTSAASLYVNSRKAGDLAGDVLKVQKIIATARSYAISTPDSSYQATFWPARSLFWIDAIQPAVPSDKTTVIKRAKIVNPVPVSDQVMLAAVTGDAIVQETLSDGTVAYHVRCYSDGSSDDGSVYLIRKADRATNAANSYQKIRIYGPTAQTRLFKDQPAP